MRSFRIAALAAASLATWSCASSTSTATAAATTPEVAGGPNTLTKAEKSAGWKLLFDGTTTTGWRGYRETTMPNGWSAKDGTLTKATPSNDIITTATFKDF